MKGSLNLPGELLNYLFQSIPLHTRVLLRSVCQQWNDVILHGNPLDPINFELKKIDILRAVLDARQNVFITGPGGVGKTVTLNVLHQEAMVRRLDMVMLAPTQMAAEHLPLGRTIHSFLRIKKTLTKKQLDELLSERAYRRPLDTKPQIIVVDECSMFGSKLMYCMDRLLREFYQSKKPFAGIQMVLCGDFYQLPPVCDSFCFNNPLWDELDMQTFRLSVPLRQCDDQRWFDLLQLIRRGERSTVEDASVHTRIYKDVKLLMDNLEPRPVFLSSDNRVVEELNDMEFAKNGNPIQTVLQAEDHFYQLEKVNGKIQRSAIAPPSGVKLDTFWRCPQQLPIKVGARYICTMNLDKEIGVINGRSCTYLGDDMMQLDNGNTVPLHSFYANFEYMVGNNIMLVRHQVALRLGYAMTIHKSQGMTLDKVVCDFRTVRCAGSFYVALSRVRKIGDIFLVNTSKEQKIPVSKEVRRFYLFDEE